MIQPKRFKNITKENFQKPKNSVWDRILKVFEARLKPQDKNNEVESQGLVSAINVHRNYKHTPQDVQIISGRHVTNTVTCSQSPTCSFNPGALMSNKQKQRKVASERVVTGEIHVISSDNSPEYKMDDSENSRLRRKKRKSRTERNKTKSKLASSTKNETSHKSTNNVSKHVNSTQNRTNAEQLTVEKDNSSLCRITNTRLTKRLGLFNLGKKSSVIEREPIIVTDSVRKKTDADLWKILHNDKQDGRSSKMDIDDIISPRDEVLPLPVNNTRIKTGNKSLSSIELLIPPRPNYSRTPSSKSYPGSATSFQILSLSLHSATTTGISTGSTHRDFTSKSLPLKDIYNFITKNIKKHKILPVKDYLQETCDSLKKLLKHNAAPTETPMTCRINSRTAATATSASNNSSIQRSLLQSFLQENQESTDHGYARSTKMQKNWNPKKTDQSFTQDRDDGDIQMITCSQSSLPEVLYSNAKSLLECNDILEDNRPRVPTSVVRDTTSFVNSSEMMDIGTFPLEDGGSRAMTTSQSSGFHSVHDLTPSIDHILGQDQSSLQDHRLNLRTAIERASNSRPTIRSTEAVITELQPQFMPGFHGEFYKDTLQKADNIWPESQRLTQHQTAAGLDILELLDNDKPQPQLPPQFQSFSVQAPLHPWHYPPPTLLPPTITSSPPKLFPRRLY